MTTNLDTLLTQALALVSEDRRGQLADIIEQIVTAAQTAANDLWVTRLYDWEPTPAVDAIGYVVHGPAFGSNPEQVRQVHELIWAARARAGKGEAANG